MALKLTRNQWIFIFLGILVISIHGYREIPFYSRLGLDFQNLFIFHRCQMAGVPGTPYEVSGALCGDWLDRPMIYPPALYYFFNWTRLFSFETGYRLWALAIWAMTFFSTAAWGTFGGVFETTSKKTSLLSSSLIWTMSLLFCLQVPVLYAMERGNNDVLVLVLWTLSLFQLKKKNKTLAGLFVGAASALKIYPAIATGILCFSFLNRKQKNGWQFLTGVALGVLLLVLPFGKTSLLYCTHILPEYAHTESWKGLTAHALPPLFLEFPWVATGLQLLLLATWIVFAFRRGFTLLVFTGALGLSTYFANVSNDYNFITAYPFLLVLALQALKSQNKGEIAWALLGWISILGDRSLFFGKATGHVMLQLVFWIGFVIWSLKKQKGLSHALG